MHFFIYNLIQIFYISAEFKNLAMFSIGGKQMNNGRIRQPSAGHVPQKPKQTNSTATTESPIAAKNPSVIPDPETHEMLAKMDRMAQELEEAINRTLESTKMTKSQFDAFLNDRKNFSPQQWEEIQKLKASLGKQFISLFGNEGTAFVEKVAVTKATKAKRGKSLGARKKWIPM